MAQYKLNEGSIHERFLKSTAKVQVFGGGFGNGKTAAACIKAIELSKAYPGSNGLIARSTYPKLNDTIRKEFLKWCPKEWIKSFPMGQNGSNTCTLKNGTTINFRYIQQQGKIGTEATTSNLLSATYDWIIVDQMEDPEITHKDFLDLLGRLRGNTPREESMSLISERDLPLTGPRWFIICTNPTRNWLYKKLIEPLHKYMKQGVITEELLCERNEDESPVLDEEGKPKLMLELFEGATYENKENLGADFIKTLETAYKGQMRERFLLGKWGAYEGLVYPQCDETIHGVSYKTMFIALKQLREYYQPTFIESFDYGLAVPSCYGLAFVDFYGNVHLIDGFYEKELSIEQIARRIKEIRSLYMTSHSDWKRLTSFADPAIFKRSASSQIGVAGRSIAAMLAEDHHVYFQRGNNDIVNGITKVSSYLNLCENRQHAYQPGMKIAPFMYIVNELDWFWTEIGSYAWAKTSQGDAIDKPVDRDDHAMDMLKYMLTDRPEVGELIPDFSQVIHQMNWFESEQRTRDKKVRYGH